MMLSRCNNNNNVSFLRRFIWSSSCGVLILQQQNTIRILCLFLFYCIFLLSFVVIYSNGFVIRSSSVFITQQNHHQMYYNNNKQLKDTTFNSGDIVISSSLKDQSSLSIRKVFLNHHHLLLRSKRHQLLQHYMTKNSVNEPDEQTSSSSNNNGKRKIVRIKDLNEMCTSRDQFPTTISLSASHTTTCFMLSSLSSLSSMIVPQPSSAAYPYTNDIVDTTATATTTTNAKPLSSKMMININNDGNEVGESYESIYKNHPNLIADLPMIRLKLPDGSIGREYVAIQLKINNNGPFTFMVDTGLTTEMITPHLQQSLGLDNNINRKSQLQSFGAGGSTLANQLIELNHVQLCCGEFNNNNEYYEIPIKLNAVTTDFPQEHIDPKYDPVEGMLGMELLSLYDIDFDFPNYRLRFWKPNTVITNPEVRKGLTQIPAATINETGLIGIRITIPNSNGQPPILGFLDCGSTFSIINWAATPYLGLSNNPKDNMYHDSSSSSTTGPEIIAIGIDGKPMKLPTKLIPLTFAGNPIIGPSSSSSKPKSNTVIGSNTVISFESAPTSFIPWKPTYIAIGDLPAFSLILSPNPNQKYNGPAALIGLDILSQRRIIFEAQHLDQSRQRNLFIS